MKKYINSIALGDNMEHLAQLPDNSIDSLISDPPYGFKFLGKKWDESVPDVKFYVQCHRVLKPGGFAFVMSSSRQDVLAQNINNIKEAGFEIGYTSIYWTYASGFSKATNMSKSVDRHLGAQGKVVAISSYKLDFKAYKNCPIFDKSDHQELQYKALKIRAPETEEAKKLAGSYAGFLPKPAIEVVIVAMKPLDTNSYRAQALSNGKGVTWLDDCRIPFAKGEKVSSRDFIKQPSSSSGQVIKSEGELWIGNDAGRFSPNLLVSDQVLGPYSKYFDLDHWAQKSIDRLPSSCRETFPFLIVSKPTKKERHGGLESLEPKLVKDRDHKVPNTPHQRGTVPKLNTNPCVKPVKLMAYLVALGSRPGDLILDPFAGSGSTCIAAKLMARYFIGIEQSEEYQRIAEKRIKHASDDNKYFDRLVSEVKAAEEKADDVREDGPQAEFFSNDLEMYKKFKEAA